MFHKEKTFREIFYLRIGFAEVLHKINATVRRTANVQEDLQMDQKNLKKEFHETDPTNLGDERRAVLGEEPVAQVPLFVADGGDYVLGLLGHLVKEEVHHAQASLPGESNTTF